MLTRSKLWAAVLLLATFAAGRVVGGAASAAWGESDGRDARHARSHGSYGERLQRELELTSEQHDSVDAILERREAAMHALMQEISPRLDSLRTVIRGEIMSLLDGTQQEWYEALIARSDSLRAERRHGRRHE